VKILFLVILRQSFALFLPQLGRKKSHYIDKDAKNNLGDGG
jgi:hypothetical protein